MLKTYTRNGILLDERKLGTNIAWPCKNYSSIDDVVDFPHPFAVSQYLQREVIRMLFKHKILSNMTPFKKSLILTSKSIRSGQCRSSPSLAAPKMLTGAPLMVIYKNVFDVMLHLEVEWPSKQNILIPDTILAEPGTYPGFKVWGGQDMFLRRKIFVFIICSKNKFFSAHQICGA